MDADELIPELNSIFYKRLETNSYSEESHSSLLFPDIPDLVGDREKKKNNDTSDDQLREITEEWSRLHLINRNRDPSIQVSDIFSKRSHQEQLGDFIP